jgi:hypothetical protein
MGATMGRGDFMGRQYPLDGISVEDLTAALAVVAASPDVGEVRVLRIEARHDSHLLVQTGFQAGPRAGSGRYILLRRTDTSWAIVEVSRWKS